MDISKDAVFGEVPTKRYKFLNNVINSPTTTTLPKLDDFKSDSKNHMKKFKNVVSNWLNGIPVKKVKKFEAEAVRNSSRNRLRKSSSSLRITDNQNGLRQVSTNNSDLGRVPSTIFSTTEELSVRSLFTNCDAIPENLLDDDGDPIQKFCDNRITTTKYTILTFLPINLFEQFRRIANSYFLAMILLQLIPVLHQINVFVAAIPLLIVVVATGAKDAFEDYRRYKLDTQFNRRKALICSAVKNVNGVQPTRKLSIVHFFRKVFGYCKKLKPRTHKDKLINSSTASSIYDNNFQNDRSFWRVTKWCDIRVGDVIFLKEGDPVPADVVLLSASGPNNTCYVETKDLDGESNLKMRSSPMCRQNDTEEKFDTELLLNNLFRIDCELPSSNLAVFYGKLFVKPVVHNEINIVHSNESLEHNAGHIYSLNHNNILLRGSCLRNSSFAVGIVVYTGRDSKIMMNSGGVKLKRTRIEHQMNPMVILNLVMLLVICILVAVLRTTNASNAVNTIAPYAYKRFSESSGEKNSFSSGFVSFCTCVLLLQTLVPISLYMAVEFCRTIQAWFMNNDIEMFDETLNKRCVPKAWNLSDDLGQIEYIFSDKTGTLTKNIMKLRQISIGSEKYGMMMSNSTSSNTPQPMFLPAYEYAEELQKMNSMREALFTPKYQAIHETFADSKIMHDLMLDNNQSESIVSFFQILCLCHAALTKISQDEAHNLPSIHYLSQSPDETALLKTCKDLGFVFVGREKNTLTLNVLGENVQYTLLETIEFTEERKKMSVIVKDRLDRILLLSKGADSAIFKCLRDPESEISITTLENLESFAEKGLRTICIAYRELSEDEYASWSKTYKDATVAIYDRERKIEAASKNIERDLMLVGCTAVEDELQDGVTEAIQLLQKAGIKLWVLTGDKVETAINIGFSCNFLNRNMNLIIIKNQTDSKCICRILQDSIRQLYHEFIQSPESQRDQFALVVDGVSLRSCLSCEESRYLFLTISCLCKTVICCRVSPLQKAKVVELVKHHKHSKTLAIGDGANDISMIRTADVGVGIFGREGTQASMASDYSITQFRHLTRLLLVHGRWSYIRIGATALTALYKNLLFVIVIFYFQFYCYYSAANAYTYAYNVFFNVVFTVFPSIVIGIFKSDIKDNYCMKVPQLYKRCIAQRQFNIKQYFLFILQGIYMSLICYFIPLGVYGDKIIGSSGGSLGFYQFGSVMIFCVVFICNIFVGINVENWSLWIFLSVLGNNFVFVIFFIVYTFTYDVLKGQFAEVLGNPLFYFTFMLVMIMSFGPTILIKFAVIQFFPRDIDLVTEIQNTNINEEKLFRSALAAGQTHTSRQDLRNAAQISEMFSLASAIEEKQLEKQAAESPKQPLSPKKSPAFGGGDSSSMRKNPDSLWTEDPSLNADFEKYYDNAKEKKFEND